jgi:hypothetical protein
MIPKLYCGDKTELPEGYTDNGSRYHCLKKGVGVGLNIQRDRNQKNNYEDDVVCSACEGVIKDYSIRIGRLEPDTLTTSVYKFCSNKCANRHKTESVPAGVSRQMERIKQETKEAYTRDEMISSINEYQQNIQTLTVELSNLRREMAVLQTEKYNIEKLSAEKQSGLSTCYAKLDTSKQKVLKCKEKIRSYEEEIMMKSREFDKKIYEEYNKYKILQEQYSNLSNQLLSVETSIDKYSGDNYKKLLSEIVVLRRELLEKDNTIYDINRQITQKLEGEIDRVKNLMNENKKLKETIIDLENKKTKTDIEINKIMKSKTNSELLAQRQALYGKFGEKINDIQDRIDDISQQKQEEMISIRSKLNLLENIIDDRIHEMKNTEKIISWRQREELSDEIQNEIRKQISRKIELSQLLQTTEENLKLLNVGLKEIEKEDRTYAPEEKQSFDLEKYAEQNPKEAQLVVDVLSKQLQRVKPSDKLKLSKKIANAILGGGTSYAYGGGWGATYYTITTTIYEYLISNIKDEDNDKLYKLLAFVTCIFIARNIFVRLLIYQTYSFDLVYDLQSHIPTRMAKCSHTIMSEFKRIAGKKIENSPLTKLIDTSFPQSFISLMFKAGDFATNIGNGLKEIGLIDKIPALNLLPSTHDANTLDYAKRLIDRQSNEYIGKFLKNTLNTSVTSLYDQLDISVLNIKKFSPELLIQNARDKFSNVLDKLGIDQLDKNIIFKEIDHCGEAIYNIADSIVTTKSEKYKKLKNLVHYPFSSTPINDYKINIGGYTDQFASSDMYMIFILLFWVYYILTGKIKKRHRVKIVEFKTFTSDTGLKKIGSGLISALSETAIGKQGIDNIKRKQQLLQSGDVNALIRETQNDTNKIKELKETGIKKGVDNIKHKQQLLKSGDVTTLIQDVQNDVKKIKEKKDELKK